MTTALAALALAARLLLVAVFAVAGIAKLTDRTGTREGIVGFGVPARMAGTAAVLVPVAELAVAALLLPAATAVYGSLGALVLLVLFSGAIAWNLARGRTPDCHCFGQLGSAPAGGRTLARNGVLAGCAVVALAGSLAEPALSPVAWLGDLEPAELVAVTVGVAALIVLALGAVAFVSVMRSYGRVLLRLERVEAALTEAGIEVAPGEDMPRQGLQPGTPAPWFVAASPDRTGLSLDDLLAPGLPLLLLFTTPNCGACAALLPDAARWQREHADALTIAFASSDLAEAVAAEARELGLSNVLADEAGELAASFQAVGTPSAVLIAADGTVSSWLATGGDEIEMLLEAAVRPSANDAGLPVGSEAPDVELESLDGEPLKTSTLHGRDTLYLFWNPECGYCRAMHEDILAWEGQGNDITPRLVVVSSGDRESSAAEGFRSIVLLDTEFAAGSAFGADGTPMAVLVGDDGRLASPVVAGADAVLELANREVERH